MKQDENKCHKTGNKMGRPTTFTAEKGQIIVNSVRKNLSIFTAAGLARTPHQNVFNWLKIGEKHMMEGKETEMADFSANVYEARALKVAEMLGVLEEMPKGWQAISWILEKCVQEEFGRETELYKKLMEDYQRLMQAVLDAKSARGG